MISAPAAAHWRLFPALALAAGLLTLAACASQIMKGYVGAPVTSIILDYGPPDTVLELGRDERAYQWHQERVHAVAGHSTGVVRDTRRGERIDITETPGYVERTDCFYTFYARRSGADWYVTSFRQPRLECE